jgi:hypothetical protein
MLVARAISLLLMPAALTLLDYHYLCLGHVRGFAFWIGEGDMKERKKEI